MTDPKLDRMNSFAYRREMTMDELLRARVEEEKYYKILLESWKW